MHRRNKSNIIKTFFLFFFFIFSPIFSLFFPFFFSGNEIDPTLLNNFEVEETRRRSCSEGNYEKKRKYQLKNSISSCVGFSSNMSRDDFGSLSLGIDSSSGEFEVRICNFFALFRFTRNSLSCGRYFFLFFERFICKCL